MIVTYILGFLTAMPVGATQIEIAKRSLNNHLRSAYMVALGSASSDIMYGFIALFGVAPFMKDKIVIAIFDLAATLILWILSYFTFKTGMNVDVTELGHATLRNKRISYITGFSLAATNPMMIIWWLIGVKIIKDLGLVSSFSGDTSLIFVIVGGLGLASYLCTLANTLHWAKKFISNEKMKKVNFALGVILALLSFYFLFGSLRILLHA
ncbi:MAG TPA: LysE family transporter [Candidatus Kryptonia bacterium]